MVMIDSLNSIREQPFYVGQILRVRSIPEHRPELCALEDLLKRVKQLRGSSLEHILKVLGFHEVYAAHLGALEVAFPENSQEGKDVILIAPFSRIRELTWQLICLVEALDMGQRCIVLCPNRLQAEAAKASLISTVQAADIEYAIEIAGITNRTEFTVFDGSIPLIAIFTPETLRMLLQQPDLEPAREIMLSALSRVAVPSVSEWPTPLASHTAFLLRELHLECAIRGVRPSVVGTSDPSLFVEEYVSNFWGKTVDGDAFVRRDSVESTKLQLINYSGGLVRDQSSNTARWVRQNPRKVAEDLLGWLVGSYSSPEASDLELHYVLDISASMSDAIDSVKGAIIRDLKMKLEDRALTNESHVKLTVFHTEASLVFNEVVSTEILKHLETTLATQRASGGTDLPVGLGSALESAVKGGVGAVHVVLFSDGESSISSQQHTTLMNLARQARASGRILRILYVVLEMDPPAETRNLIFSMGGKIIKQSSSEMDRVMHFEVDDVRRGTIVFLSGEKGLPSDIIQKFSGGLRPIIYTRNIKTLQLPALDVGAVVVSGHFAGHVQICDQIRHLGRELLPVFILTEAEASAQLVLEEFPEADGLTRVPVICADAPWVVTSRLTEFVGKREIDVDQFRYIMEGAQAYDAMLRSLGILTSAKETTELKCPLDENALPAEFELIKKGSRHYVRLSGETDWTSNSTSLRSFSSDVTIVSGSGITSEIETGVAPLIYHCGAVCESDSRIAEVSGHSGDMIELRAKTYNRFSPLLRAPSSQPLFERSWDSAVRKIDNLGEVRHGQIAFSVKLVGSRCFPNGNLDGSSQDEMPSSEVSIQFPSRAISWKPGGASSPVLAGLANLLRLALPSVLGQVNERVFVYPDFDEESIWLVELVPGGNGTVAVLRDHIDLFQKLLSLGGRIALECPCEGGFAGASTAEAKVPNDTGCPRCTRSPGPVVLDGPDDRFGQVSKKETLQWLLLNRYLPTSAAEHLKEKYEGITDASRISRRDQGSRRGCIQLIRRILGDRLGLQIEDRGIARFAWLPAEDEELLGVYYPDGNKLALQKGLREWLALDVCAHELFHNYQNIIGGLFRHERIGPLAEPKPPFDGKLFLEGSAMWAESHAVDSLAIRSSLEFANLRNGDEYGVGFQMLKYIEENFGGVSAVLSFLASGDISAVTGGKVRDLEQFYQLFPVDTED